MVPWFLLAANSEATSADVQHLKLSDMLQLQVAEATIYNNRAASLLEVKDYAQALRDADCAAQLRKGWSKPYFRMAQVTPS